MILQRKSNFNRHPRVELSLPSLFFQQILINYFEEQLRRLQQKLSPNWIIINKNFKLILNMDSMSHSLILYNFAS